MVFRILAPSAQSVRLNAGDIPGDARQRVLVKGEIGVWELTLGPIDPGSYRYTINVDGVSVVDPRSHDISESNGNVWSVVHVPGASFMDAGCVAGVGAVAGAGGVAGAVAVARAGAVTGAAGASGASSSAS